MPVPRNRLPHGFAGIKQFISSSAVVDLSELGDVSLSSLTNGEVLTYASSSGKWENLPSAAIAIGGLVSGSTQYWGATQSTYIPIWISGNAIGRSSLKVEGPNVPERFQGFEYRYNPADEDYLMAKLWYVSSSAVTGGRFQLFDLNDVAWVDLTGESAGTSLFMNDTGFGSSLTAGTGRINVSGAISLDEGAGSDSTVYLKTITGQDADLEIRSHNDLKIKADTGGVSSKQRITLEGYNYLISGAQTQGPVMAISGTSGGSGYGAQVAIVPYNTVGGVGMSETWYGTDSQNFNVYGTTLLSGATTISGTLGLWDTLDLYADLDLNLNDLWNVKDFTASGSTFFVSGNTTTFKNADFTVNSDTNTGDFSILSGAYHQFKVDYDTNSIGMAYATPKTDVAVGIGGFAQGKTAAHLALYNYHGSLSFVASSTTGASPDIYLSGSNKVTLQAPNRLDLYGGTTSTNSSKVKIDPSTISIYTSGTSEQEKRVFIDATGAVMIGDIYHGGDPLTGYLLDVRGDTYISGTTIAEVVSGTTSISGNTVYGMTHKGVWGNFVTVSGSSTVSGTTIHGKQASLGLHLDGPTQTGSNGFTLSVGHALGSTRDIAIYGDQDSNHGIRFVSGTVAGGSGGDFSLDHVASIYSNLDKTNPYLRLRNEIGGTDLYIGLDGVGIETSSPAEALHVAGKILATHISGTTSISGATFYGDGSNLTGIADTDNVSSSTATNIAYYVNSDDVSGSTDLQFTSVGLLTPTISSTTAISGATFYGDGSNLTGISESAHVSSSTAENLAYYVNTTDVSGTANLKYDIADDILTVSSMYVSGGRISFEQGDARYGSITVWGEGVEGMTLGTDSRIGWFNPAGAAVPTNYIAGNAVTHDLSLFTSGTRALYLTSSSQMGVNLTGDDGVPTQTLDVRGNAFISGSLIGTNLSGTTAISGATYYGVDANFTNITGTKIIATTISGTTAVSGATLYGDGSNITGLPAGVTTQVSSSTQYDVPFYVNTTDISGNTGFTYNGTNVDMKGALNVSGTSLLSGNTTVGGGLHVNKGADNANPWITGSTNTPAYTFYGDQDTGMYRAGANTLAFETAGTARITIDGDGDVGIGTGSPAYKLQVVGTLQTSDNIRAENSSFMGGREDAAAPTYRFHDDGDTGMFNVASNILAFATSGTEQMRILESGYVGIGNDSPVAQFVVKGDTGIAIEHSNSQGNHIYSDSDGNLVFGGQSVAGVDDYVWINDDSGYVGIGTSGPAYTLDVNGTFGVSGNAIVSGNVGANLSIAPAYPIHVSQSSGDTYGMYQINDAGRGIYFGDTSNDGTGFGKIGGVGGDLFFGSSQVYTSFLGTGDANTTLGSAGRRWSYFYTRYGQAGYSTSAAEDTRYVWAVSSSAAKDPFIVRTHGQAGPTFIVTSGGNVSGSGAISGSTFYGDGSNLTGITHTTSQISSSTAGNLAYYVNTTDVSGNTDLVWDASNVRLGIGTASPEYALDVVRHTTSPVFAAKIYNDENSGKALWLKGGLRVEDNASATTKFWDISSDSAANLGLKNTAGTTHFYLLSGGNLGLGTDAPDGKLDVRGTFYVNSSDSGNTVAHFTSNDGLVWASFNDSSTSDTGQVRVGANANRLVLIGGGKEAVRMYPGNSEGIVWNYDGYEHANIKYVASGGATNLLIQNDILNTPKVHVYGDLLVSGAALISGATTFIGDMIGPTISGTTAISGATFYGDGSNLTGITHTSSQVSSSAANNVAFYVNSTDVSGNTGFVYDGTDVTLSSSTSAKPVLMIKNTNADANASELQFYKKTTGEADNDVAGNISFYFDNDGSVDGVEKVRAAQIYATSVDVTEDSEDGAIFGKHVYNGTEYQNLHLGGHYNAANSAVWVGEEGQSGFLGFANNTVSNNYLLFGTRHTTGSSNQYSVAGLVVGNAAYDGNQQLTVRAQDDVTISAGYEGSTANSTIAFRTNNATESNNTERMRITKDGEVGINTTTALESARLTILEGTNPQLVLANDATNYFSLTEDGNYLNFTANSGDTATMSLRDNGNTYFNGQNVIFETSAQNYFQIKGTNTLGFGDGADFTMLASGASFYITSGTSKPWPVADVNNAFMTIKTPTDGVTSGSIGFGTSKPLAQVHISGAVASGGTGFTMNNGATVVMIGRPASGSGGEGTYYPLAVGTDDPSVSTTVPSYITAGPTVTRVNTHPGYADYGYGMNEGVCYSIRLAGMTGVVTSDGTASGTKGLGNFGGMVFHANSNWSGNARRWLVSNAWRNSGAGDAGIGFAVSDTSTHDPTISGSTPSVMIRNDGGLSVGTQSSIGSGLITALDSSDPQLTLANDGSTYNTFKTKSLGELEITRGGTQVALLSGTNVIIGKQAANDVDSAQTGESVFIGEKAGFELKGNETHGRHTIIGAMSAYTLSGTTDSDYITSIGAYCAYGAKTEKAFLAIGAFAGYYLSGSGDAPVLLGNGVAKGTALAAWGTNNGVTTNEDVLIGNGGVAEYAEELSNNVIVGSRAAGYLRTGTANVAVGKFAFRNASGSDGTTGNVSLGYSAGQGIGQNTDGSAAAYNIAIGYETQEKALSGDKNIAIGYKVGIDGSSDYDSILRIGNAAGDYSFIRGDMANDTFTIGTTTPKFVLSGGSVGIGTTGPSRKLHVYGDDNLLARFESSDDTAMITIRDNDTYGIIGVKDAYMFLGYSASMTTNNLILTNTNAVVKVGIGTLAPAYNLDITGTTNLNGATTFTEMIGATLSGTTAVSGATFYGDGSNLTGITATTTQVSSSTANNLAYYVSTTDVSGSTALTWDGSILNVDGIITATAKAFNIAHPIYKDKKLIHGSLEGPEHGMYVRGTLEGSGPTHIELPNYWPKLVGSDYTVQLTSYNSSNVYIVEKYDNSFMVDCNLLDGQSYKFDYLVVGSRENFEVVQ